MNNSLNSDLPTNSQEIDGELSSEDTPSQSPKKQNNSSRKKFVNEREEDIHENDRSRSALDDDSQQVRLNQETTDGELSGKERQLSTSNKDNSGTVTDDEVTNLLFAKLPKTTNRSEQIEMQRRYMTVTTPVNEEISRGNEVTDINADTEIQSQITESNHTGNNNESQRAASIQKGKKRVARALLVDEGADDSSGSSDDSHSSSSSSESSSDVSTDEELKQLLRRKRKHKGARKYKPRKRKYKRSRSGSTSRSKLNKKKCKESSSIEDRPEFRRALDKRLRELGYSADGRGTGNRDRSRSHTPGKTFTPDKVIKSPSDTTLYVPAVKKAGVIESIPSARDVESQISEQLNNIRFNLPGRTEDARMVQLFDGANMDNPQPGTSGEKPENLVAAAKEAANQAIVQGEKLINPTGQYSGINVVDHLGTEILDDDQFIHITSHVDSSIREKIRRGEYIELEKLLKRNRTSGLDKDNGDMTLDVDTRDGHT